MRRYISGNEAVWRILSFPIHDRYPAVIHLAMHLEHRQRVYFNEQNAQTREMSFARTLYNHDVPKYFT